MKNNSAFIDSQNLNLSIRSQGWILDYRKFRKYLKEGKIKEAFPRDNTLWLASYRDSKVYYTRF